MLASPFGLPLVILAEKHAETDTRRAITVIAKQEITTHVRVAYLRSRRTVPCCAP
jgi:hypothetical protein